MRYDAKSIIQKYNRLWSDDANFRTLWQDSADYIIPRRSNILQQPSPGTKQTTKLFDSTAIHANELLGASMKQSIMPANLRWFSLRVRDEDVMDNQDIQEWLEDCSDRMFLALHQSNFDSEAQEVNLDLGAFGMGAMYVEETIPWQGLRFHSCSIGDYCIEENSDGMVDTVIRKFGLNARSAWQRWGNNAGEKVLKAVEKKPEQYFWYLHMVTPLRPGIYQGYYVGVEDKNMPERPKLFREFPYLVPRWGKTSGEKNGRGPGFTAMPDIKTLNKAVYLELQALSKMINPPIKQSDGGVIGVPRLTPGGMVTIRPNATFEPLTFQIDLNTYQVRSEDLKKSIRQIFFSDQLQFQDTPQMTAAEVYVRYELMQRILGPTLGRMEREFLSPLIKRVFRVMSRAGLFLPMPDSLSGYESAIDIEYEGTMAQAQKSQQITGMKEVLDILALTAQVSPDVFDWLNLDGFVSWLWEVKGVPKKLLSEARDVKKIREQRAAEGVMAKGRRDSMMVAEVIRKMTQALKAGVISPDVLNGLLGAQPNEEQAE